MAVSLLKKSEVLIEVFLPFIKLNNHKFDFTGAVLLPFWTR